MNPFADLARPIVSRPGDAIAPARARPERPAYERPEPNTFPVVPNPWGLSPTEAEVIRLIVEGLTSQEIGERINRSPKTVEVHRLHIMEKMDERSTLTAAVAWVRFTMAAEKSPATNEVPAAAAIVKVDRVALVPITVTDFYRERT
jgi:DNA-binding CsgD family transcriptional regulator